MCRQSRQRGFATLTTSMVMLLLISLISVYSARTVLFEQKISSNDFRSRMSFEAAESGLQSALAYVNDGWDRDPDTNPGVDPIFDTDNDGIGDSNTSTLANDSTMTVTVTVTGTAPNFSIVSTGESEDRSASRTISTVTSVPDALPNAPDNPLTTKGSVVINGSATVHNLEGASTIWSGDDVNLGSNNATATNVADPGDADYPGCMDITLSDDPSNICDSLQSSNKINVGLDVIEHDSNLGNLTPDEMFENFFGISMAAYRERSVTLEVAPANIGNLASDEPPGLGLATNEVVYIDGDTDNDGDIDASDTPVELPNGNLTVGCKVSITGNSLCTGDDIQPSIVIVNGNLNFNGTPNFTGLVYVHGNIVVGGNVTNLGAVIVGGDVTSNTGGSFDVWYDSDVLNNLRSLGNIVQLAGSWHDW